MVLLHTAVSEEEATKAKNLQFTYDPTFKAYFRFQDLGNKFKKDEFVDWSWVQFKNEPEDSSEYIGVDIIPNDVCPIIMPQLSLVHFNNETVI